MFPTRTKGRAGPKGVDRINNRTAYWVWEDINGNNSPKWNGLNFAMNPSIYMKNTVIRICIPIWKELHKT